jgi:integrase
MPRPATGTMEPRTLADGSRAFRIRVRINGQREPIVLHERHGCTCGCGGGWDEPSARTEMGNILARIRAGVWERPEPPPTLVATAAGGEVPTYDEYAGWFLQAKVDGVIGEKPIAPNTRKKDKWRLGYSRRFFAGIPVDEINENLALEFKADLLAEAREQQEAIAAGANLRDQNGRKVVPLGLTSIKMILDSFASILDEAIEDKHREDNPARSKRMHISAPKPKRSFLEMDELAALLDAASDQDIGLPDLTGIAVATGSSAEKVARLAAGGKRPKQIAADLALSKATVDYHLKRLGIDLGRGYVGRRVTCELLGRAGLRVSEVCDLKIGKVRLHDPEGARLRVVDAKTEVGERVVEITPEQAEVIIEHVDRLRRAGMPTGAEDYLVPNARGRRISRQRIGKIVAAAAKLASERLTARGLPPLPNTTPHTLRRTYISGALRANEFDVKWVMSQVGHKDSAMTMDVYAQLQQRAERHHGPNFDRLLGKARRQLADLAVAA